MLKAALNEKEIASLKKGEVVEYDGKFLAKGKDGKAHILKTSVVRAIKTFALPHDSSMDLFMPTGDEMRKAIDAYFFNNGINGTSEVIAYRTAGKGESRADIDSCSIRVYFSLIPANGVQPSKPSQPEAKQSEYTFADWQYGSHRVEYASRYEEGEAVTIVKAIEEVAL